jgi:amino acid transporter
MYLGANVFAMAVCALFMWLLIDRVSNQFFTSSNYVAIAQGNGDVPVTPLYSIFIMSMVKWPILWLWIMITFSAWFWIWPTNNYVGSTRFMFAMSFDRMLPSFLARVFARTATPIYALGVAFVGMVIFGYLYWYTSFSKLTLDLPLFAAIAFGGTTLAATLMPYLPSSRRIYESSPLAKYTLGPLPLITVLGALSVAYFVFMIYLYATDDRYGVNSPTGLWFALGLFAGAIAFYLGFKILRRRQGINVERTYHEIPSE